MRWTLMLVAVLLAACEECEPEATRCVGNAAEICSSDGRWEPLADCDEIEGGGVWQCCADANGDFNCRPEADCAGGDQ